MHFHYMHVEQKLGVNFQVNFEDDNNEIICFFHHDKEYKILNNLYRVENHHYSDWNLLMFHLFHRILIE